MAGFDVSTCGANSLIHRAENRTRESGGVYSCQCFRVLFRLLACLLSYFASPCFRPLTNRADATSTQQPINATIIHHGQIQHRPLDGRRESSPPRRPRAPRPGLGRHQPRRRDQVRIRIATVEKFLAMILMCRFLGSQEGMRAQDTGTSTDGRCNPIAPNDALVSGGVGSVRREGLRIRQSQKCTLRAGILPKIRPEEYRNERTRTPI